MGNYRTVDWCPCGIRLRFSRDISQKYSRYFGHERPQDTFERGDWCVIGYHDFLDVAKFKRLTGVDTLAGPKPKQRVLAPQRTYTDLILLPFEGSSDDGFMDQLCTPTADSPLLMICSMSLSPAARDFDGERTRLLESLRVFADLLNTHLPDSVRSVRRAFFGSLSGPDVVLLALPRDASELWASHYLVRKSRQMRLASLEQGELSDLDEERAAKWEGHALGALTPTLAFQLSSEAVSKYRSGAFHAQEAEAGLGYLFQLKVDCGHEAAVVEDIRKACNGRVSFSPYGNRETSGRTNWHSHTLQGYLHHLSDLADLCQDCLFSVKDENWREQNLVDSFTVVSLEDRHPTDKAQDYHYDRRAWTLTMEAREELDAIGTALEEFGSQFLSKPQHEELLSVFQMFHSCFYRQEFVGAARDLLPFFRQFASALSLGNEWKEFLERPTSGPKIAPGETMWAYEEFAQQMDYCLSHLGRAVRNRMEHRSVRGDPPVPHTLAHGGCKLVNAYTITAYLSTEVLLRPVGYAQSFSRFAGAVCAGWNGRVVCAELFQEFRQHLEGKLGKKLSELGLGANVGLGGWNARLLLLDISGKTLLRPSRCFVHCLHEVAEISEWIEKDGCRGLRRGLNGWVLGEIIATLNYEVVRSFLDEAAVKQPQHAKELQLRRDSLEFSSEYVCQCLRLRVSGNENEESVDEVLQRYAPAVLADYLLDAVKSASANVDDVMSHVRGKTEVTAVADHCQRTALSDEFACSVEQVREFATEMTGDTGLWFALQHILYADSDAPDTAARLDDAAKVYRSLLVAASESCGETRDRSRLDRSIVHRWAIQAAANSADDDSWGDAILDHVSEELTHHAGVISREAASEYLNRSKRNSMQFREPGGLVSVLSRYKGYGGENDDPTCGALLQGWEGDILHQFRIAWRESRAEDEIRLVMSLWEASESFGLERVLEPAYP